jgi:uncharacterized protein (DUF1778 family)
VGVFAAEGRVLTRCARAVDHCQTSPSRGERPHSAQVRSAHGSRARASLDDLSLVVKPPGGRFSTDGTNSRYKDGRNPHGYTPLVAMDIWCGNPFGGSHAHSGLTFARKTPRTAQPREKASQPTKDSRALRNTLESPRSVVPVRLSEAERSRISKAAEARDLAFSSFVRWAALERAADELERARAKPRPKPVEREPVTLGDDLEPPAPEEEPFRSHSFVDGECERAAWTSRMCVAGIAPARRTAARW